MLSPIPEHLESNQVLGFESESESESESRGWSPSLSPVGSSPSPQNKYSSRTRVLHHWQGPSLQGQGKDFAATQ